jgi:hypothetical protein
MKIIEYNNYNDLVIEFQDEYKYKTNTTYQNFKIGKIKNPYDKNTFGRGYIGEGKYLTRIGKNTTSNYRAWYSMMERCYAGEDRKYFPSYIGCSMHEEWWNFQTFCKWREDEWYTCGTERMHIDKDILINGNKVYSPETCLLVPQRINMIFMTKVRKDNLPNGIRQNVSGTYVSYYNGMRYGTHKTIEEAVAEHDEKKRIHIKEVAEEYKNKVPQKVYEALLKW